MLVFSRLYFSWRGLGMCCADPFFGKRLDNELLMHESAGTAAVGDLFKGSIYRYYANYLILVN